MLSTNKMSEAPTRSIKGSFSICIEIIHKTIKKLKMNCAHGLPVSVLFLIYKKEGFCNSNETSNTIVYIEIIKSNGRHDLDSWCSLSAPFHGCLVIVWGLLTEICSGQGNVPDELLQLATICCSSLGLEIQICPHFSSKFATDESFSSKSSSKSWYSANPECD
jgi:hypothetical protein